MFLESVCYNEEYNFVIYNFAIIIIIKIIIIIIITLIIIIIKIIIIIIIIIITIITEKYKLDSQHTIMRFSTNYC